MFYLLMSYLFFTFKIERNSNEWSSLFDITEANKRHYEFDIKPVLRGVRKGNPYKVIVMHQSPEGNL